MIGTKIFYLKKGTQNGLGSLKIVDHIDEVSDVWTPHFSGKIFSEFMDALRSGKVIKIAFEVQEPHCSTCTCNDYDDEERKESSESDCNEDNDRESDY